MKIIPIKRYKNLHIEKSSLFKENKNKCGIYRWNNLISGKTYVGSSINLTRWLMNYLSPGFLKIGK